MLKKQKLFINWHETYYINLENKQSKWTFLILHWWWWKSDSWYNIWLKLQEEWYNVIIPDLPWFWNTKIKEVFDLEKYTLFIEEFVNKLQLSNFYLFWHSNWWRISIKLAVRWIIKIKKLFLNNSAWINNKPSVKNIIFKKLSLLFKPFLKFKFFKKFRIYFYKLIWGHDYLNCDNNYIKQTFLNIIKTNLIFDLSKINIPTILIWWEKDTYTKLKDWKIMHEKIQKSKLIIIKKAKHWIHLQNPDKLFSTIINNI